MDKLVELIGAKSLDSTNKKAITQEIIRKVEKFVPSIYFHEDELFFPCSIETLLQAPNTFLKDSLNGSVIASSPLSQKDLQEHPNWHYYLSLDQNTRKGDPIIDNSPTAPLYFSLTYHKEQVDISFWLLFAYQGGQTLRFFGNNLVCSKAGPHEGDLETITVSVDKDFSYVISVITEAHGCPTIHKGSDVTYDQDTHPIICSCLNGHGTYNPKKLPAGTIRDITGFSIITWSKLSPCIYGIDLVSLQGIVWKAIDLRMVNVDKYNNSITDQVWVNFSGRIGNKGIRPLRIFSALMERLNVGRTWRMSLTCGILNLLVPVNWIVTYMGSNIASAPVGLARRRGICIYPKD